MEMGKSCVFFFGPDFEQRTGSAAEGPQTSGAPVPRWIEAKAMMAISIQSILRDSTNRGR